MRRTAGPIAVLLALFALLPVVASAEVSDDDLARAREKRDQVQAELDSAATAYSHALTAVENARADIERTTQEVAVTQAHHDQVRDAVTRRAVAAYKGERGLQFVAVLASQNLSDLVDRAAYLERSTASDNALMEQLRAVASDLKARKADLARLQADQEDAVHRAEMLQHDLEGKLEAARNDEQVLIAQRAAEDEARRRAAEEEARRQAAAALPAAQHAPSGGGLPSGRGAPSTGSIVCPVGGTT